jgi:DNA-binding MurR/RpiR family transcriptional regulator
MARMDGLSPRLRSAAEFVAAHPDEVATHTLRQVAKAANLTPPTLSRLARALDCETYEDLRELCRGELKRRNRSLADKAEALLKLSTDSNAPERSGIMISQAKSAVSNIQHLMQTIDLEKLREAADSLAAARRVVLIGSSSAFAMMNYFARMGQMVFENWTVAGVDGSFWSQEIARLDSRDAAFVVSLNPYADISIRAAGMSRKSGADVIAITDGVQSPLAPIATHCFMVETDSPQFFPSHVATLVLIEGIMGMIVRREGGHAAARIRLTERFGKKLGEYWQN